jgi:hypothetical protein
MRGPIAAAVIASTFFGTLVGLASAAHAADKRKVVVEQFSGPSSDRFRQSVVSALGKMVTVEVLADKKVANVEADLGVVEVSENYEGVAKSLKATAFIGGTVTGKKPKARLTVHDAKGAVAGEYSWSAANPAKLIAAINADVSEKLAGFLGAAGGGGSEAVAVAKKEERKEELKKAREVKEAKADDEPKAESSSRKSAAAESADTEGTVSASAEAPSSSSSGGKELNIAFVMRVFSRDFTYNQKVDTAAATQGYNLQAAPAPGAAVEFFPHANFGLTAAFNYALVGSKDQPVSGKTASVYKTTAYSWSVGAKGRLPAGSFVVEPDVAYGMQVFKVEDFSTSANGIGVAGVDYKHIRAGGGLRIPFGGSSLVAGAHYLHILDAGQILSGVVDKTKPDRNWFFGTAKGGDAFAELTVPLSFVKGVQGRIGVDYRRIVYAFDVRPYKPTVTPDARVAGGATDQYLGLNLSLGYSLGL